MNLGILGKLNRQHRNAFLTALGYMLALELMLVAAILYWPSFRDNTAALKAMAAPIPMLKDMLTELEDKGAVAYVISQQFFKGCNVLGCAAATLFAAGAVAGEANRGTLEIFLLRPLTRRRILLERWIAGALQVIVPVFLTTLTIPMLMARVEETAAYGPLLLCALHQSLFLLAIYGLTFFFSTLGRTPLRIAFGMLLFAIFNFSMYMVKTVTQYSLFRLADIQTFMEVYEDASWHVNWAWFGATILVSLLGSLYVFERRVP